MSNPQEDALAKKRFLALNLVRTSGAALVLLGLLFAMDKIDVPMRHLLGVILIVIGLVDVFLMPGILAKRWRSPGA